MPSSKSIKNKKVPNKNTNNKQGESLGFTKQEKENNNKVTHGVNSNESSITEKKDSLQHFKSMPSSPVFLGEKINLTAEIPFSLEKVYLTIIRGNNLFCQGELESVKKLYKEAFVKLAGEYKGIKHIFLRYTHLRKTVKKSEEFKEKILKGDIKDVTDEGKNKRLDNVEELAKKEEIIKKIAKVTVLLLMNSFLLSCKQGLYEESLTTINDLIDVIQNDKEQWLTASELSKIYFFSSADNKLRHFTIEDFSSWRKDIEKKLQINIDAPQSAVRAEEGINAPVSSLQTLSNTNDGENKTITELIEPIEPLKQLTLNKNIKIKPIENEMGSSKCQNLAPHTNVPTLPFVHPLICLQENGTMSNETVKNIALALSLPEKFTTKDLNNFIADLKKVPVKKRDNDWYTKMIFLYLLFPPSEMKAKFTEAVSYYNSYYNKVKNEKSNNNLIYSNNKAILNIFFFPKRKSTYAKDLCRIIQANEENTGDKGDKDVLEKIKINYSYCSQPVAKKIMEKKEKKKNLQQQKKKKNEEVKGELEKKVTELQKEVDGLNEKLGKKGEKDLSRLALQNKSKSINTLKEEMSKLKQEKVKLEREKVKLEQEKVKLEQAQKKMEIKQKEEKLKKDGPESLVLFSFNYRPEILGDMLLKKLSMLVGSGYAEKVKEENGKLTYYVQKKYIENLKVLKLQDEDKLISYFLNTKKEKKGENYDKQLNEKQGAIDGTTEAASFNIDPSMLKLNSLFNEIKLNDCLNKKNNAVKELFLEEVAQLAKKEGIKGSLKKIEIFFKNTVSIDKEVCSAFLSEEKIEKMIKVVLLIDDIYRRPLLEAAGVLEDGFFLNKISIEDSRKSMLKAIWRLFYVMCSSNNVAMTARGKELLLKAMQHIENSLKQNNLGVTMCFGKAKECECFHQPLPKITEKPINNSPAEKDSLDEPDGNYKKLFGNDMGDIVDERWTQQQSISEFNGLLFMENNAKEKKKFSNDENDEKKKSNLT